MSRPVAAILAGGKSSRMGQPKEGVVFADGRAMIEHVAAALLPHCSGLIVLGACTGFDWRRLGATRIEDAVHDAGPLAGIAALLASGIAGHYLVATCDQPMLTEEVLRPLLEHGLPDRPVFLRTDRGEELDPFPCLLPATWLPQVEAALHSQNRSVRKLVRAGTPLWATIPQEHANQAASINSPADLGKWKREN